MSTITIADLDQQPQYTSSVLQLFRAAAQGRRHAVCGEPARMGCPPQAADITDALGVMIALNGNSLMGALGLCPYSETQLTLWGPVTGNNLKPEIAQQLLRSARKNLEQTPIESIRTLVDHRNRDLRSFCLQNGLTPWKDNLCFQRSLTGPLSEPSRDKIRNPDLNLQLVQNHQLAQFEHIVRLAFPDSGHFDKNYHERCNQGYHHFVTTVHDSIACAIVLKRHRLRSWISMITVADSFRGQGIATESLDLLAAHEQQQGSRELALEVLADNMAARKTYKASGMQQAFSTTIFTGPV